MKNRCVAKWTEKVDIKGTTPRKNIITIISNNPNITTTQMAAALGINRSAISKHIKRMQAEGVIRRVGP